MKIYLVDAFTTEQFTGNPAGVVIAETPEETISENLMQKIARELNASETCFAGFSNFAATADSTTTSSHQTKAAIDGIQVRYFTPVSQIDFCGHATVALFFMLKETAHIATGKYFAETRIGSVPVEVASQNGQTVISMTQNQASFEPFAEVEKLLPALGLGKDDLDGEFPVQIARAANKHLIVALNRGALPKIKMDAQKLGPILENLGVATLHAFSRRESGTDFTARNFGPHIGITEDPATGSAALAFGAYLHHLGKITPQTAQFSIFQGESMGRPGKIAVEIKGEEELESVKVSGQAVKTFSLSMNNRIARPILVE